MLFELIAAILFYAVVGTLGLYSLVMIYVLLRFSHSKILGLVLSIFYLMIMTSLYSLALSNFNAITFPALNLL